MGVVCVYNFHVSSVSKNPQRFTISFWIQRDFSFSFPSYWAFETTLDTPHRLRALTGYSSQVSSDSAKTSRFKVLDTFETQENISWPRSIHISNTMLLSFRRLEKFKIGVGLVSPFTRPESVHRRSRNWSHFIIAKLEGYPATPMIFDIIKGTSQTEKWLTLDAFWSIDPEVNT